MESQVAKRALSFWLKILDMDPDRYLRRMYVRLKNLDGSNRSIDCHSRESQLRTRLHESYSPTESRTRVPTDHDSKDMIKLAVSVMDGVLKRLSFTEYVSRTRSLRLLLNDSFFET